MRWTTFPALLFAMVVGHPAMGQATDTGKFGEQTEFNFPVYEGEVDRPYIVIGKIDDNLRKHFAFQADPTKERIYAEIWERAQKIKADAVIHAKYGETRRTLFDHGRTPISGTAIKYTDGLKPQK